jgi:hypothetical protein
MTIYHNSLTTSQCLVSRFGNHSFCLPRSDWKSRQSDRPFYKVLRRQVIVF